MFVCVSVCLWARWNWLHSYLTDMRDIEHTGFIKFLHLKFLLQVGGSET
jgi:hypothetical protein